MLHTRAGAAAALLIAFLAPAGCGSSATTSTAPSPLIRCTLTLNTGEQNFPAEGGSGAIGVTAARECTWTVAVEGSWLSLKSAQHGQGDGTVEFTAAANAEPALRRGALLLNDARAEITQAAAQCVVSLSEASASFSPAGGSGRVDVRASSALCSWSASADQPWITLRSGIEGRGSATVVFEVAATTGPPRAATLTIAGQRYSVTQSEGCTYSIAPMSAAASPQGGGGTVTIATTRACPWTASSNVNWLAFSRDSGSGPATINFTVLPTTGPERTGTAVVAGQPFAVTQSQGCTYQVQPAAHTVAASGGTATIHVSAGAGCGWTASSDASWITIQGATSGSGNGLVTFSAAPTTGPARSGTLTVAGQKVQVSQGAGCTYTISPTQESVPSSGGSGKVSVAAADGCAWTASKVASWLSITSGTSGSGAGAVTYTAAETNGPARSGTLTIAGQTFTVNQGQGCAFTIAPDNVNVPNAGGQTSFEVQSSSGCTWTAASQADWIMLASGATGNGNGTVTLTVAANAGPTRSGTVTAGGRTFTVTQGSGCSYTLTPTSENVPAAGGNGTVNVAAPSGCAWTASTSSTATWLSITSAATGSGDGSVAYTAAANAGAARSGTLTIEGRSFTVNQASGCTFTVAPEAVTSPAAGGPARIDVTAAPDCAWTASNVLDWVTVSPGGGTGSGAVDLSIAANTGPARNGNVTVAGRPVTVNQESGCTYSLSRTSATIEAAGGTGTVDVTAGPGCPWKAESQVSWIVLTPPASGVGDGTVEGKVEPNTTGAPRTGTVIIAGITFTVTQN